MATTKDRRTKAEIITQNEELKARITQLDSKNPSKVILNFDRILKILLEITGLAVAIIVGFQTCNQTTLMEGQNRIMTHQDKLMDEQTELMRSQTEMINNQTNLFAAQNSLVDTQNYLIRIQNSKVDVQNRLVLSQNDLVGLQNKLFEKQNSLFEAQNNRIVQQTYLQEAERRSSLAPFITNVLDRVDDELKVNSNNSRILSNELIGRIISLSQALKPYQYLSNDQIIDKPISPERGQLLVYLINSKLDSNTYEAIFSRADFSYSELDNVEINNAYLRKINLSNASIKNAKLNYADMTQSNLSNADFSLTQLDYSKVNQASLVNTNFSGALIRWSEIFHSELKNTKFSKAQLIKTKINSYEKLKLRGFNLNNKNDSILVDFRIIKSNINSIIQYRGDFYNCRLEHHVGSDDYIISNYFIGREKCENVNFDSTDLSYVEFNNLYFVNTSFKYSNLFESTFSNILLEMTNFDKIKIDKKTYDTYFLNSSHPLSIKPISLEYLLDEIKEDSPNLKELYEKKGWKFFNLKFIGTK